MSAPEEPEISSSFLSPWNNSTQNNTNHRNIPHPSPATPSPSCDFLIAASVPDDHHSHYQHYSYQHHYYQNCRQHTTNNTDTSTHGDDMTPQDALNHPYSHPHPSLSAFTAVSHYPYAVPSDSELQPEYLAVNAVIDREEFLSGRESSGDTDTVRAQYGRSRRYNSYEGGHDYEQGRRGSGRRRWWTLTADDGRGSEVAIESPFGDVRSVSPQGLRGAEEVNDPSNAPVDLDTREFYPDLAPAPAYDGERDGGSRLMRMAHPLYQDDLNEYLDDIDAVSQSQDSLDFRDGDSDVDEENVSAEVTLNAPGLGFPFDDEFPVTTYERNFTIDQFVQQWVCQSHAQIGSDQLFIAPQRTSILLSANRPEKVIRPAGDDRMDFFDLQQIPWWETLRAKRADARMQRDLWYRPYSNVQHTPHEMAKRIRRQEFYFREKAMYTKHRASIEHFQLRNLMSVPAYNTVHFANEWRLYSWVPAYDDLTCLMDLSRPTTWENGVFNGPVKISTMKTAHGVSIMGGFAGEYAIRAEGDTTTPTTIISGTTIPASTPSAHGYVTRDPNGITNQIDIIPHRTNRTPMGIFASNDNHLRTLDIETDTFVSDYDLSRAVNCTSTSPDGRLRVVVGDSPDALIIEADTGRPVQPLRGHRDFGFACAWSPDMLHVATGNQDKTTIIWDARMWKPLTMLHADISGYRSLHFSPVGGGPRTLLMTEPADRITIVNAQTYDSRQVHDFFGEVAGADFSPDGGSIWAANSDDMFGGFMEFERRTWGQRFGPGGLPNEWVWEEELGEDERCSVGSGRERQMRFLKGLSEEEYEGLLL